jgi:hypothetical protein
MNTGVEVAIISAAASIIVAAVSWVVTARQKRADELRKLKMERYSELLASISDLVVYGLNEKTQARYSSAFNTIALTAPQTVIKALFEFQDHIHVSNQNPSPQRHDELLSKLIFEIRSSLDLPFKDDPEEFHLRLIGGFKEPNNRLEDRLEQ